MAKKAAGPADSKPIKGKKAKPPKPAQQAVKTAKAAKAVATAATAPPKTKARKAASKSAPAAVAVAGPSGAQGHCNDELYVDAAGVLRVQGAGSGGSAVMAAWVPQPGDPLHPTLEEYVETAKGLAQASAGGAVAPADLNLTLCVPIITNAAAATLQERDQTIKALLLLFVFLNKTAVGTLGTGSSVCC